MRHGQGFNQIFQDYLSLVAQAPTGDVEPAPGFARYEPRFAYAPTDYLDAPGSGQSLTDTLGSLARLATQMHVAARKVSTSEGSLPGGYTYLGQFAIHDLVNSTGFRVTRDRNLPRGLFGNIQTPSLDLSSLYGGGPAGSPALYQVIDDTEHRARFRLGYMTDQHGNPSVQEDIARMPVGPWCGGAVGDARFDPLLADTRNADNLIISQLAVLFMQYHNMLLDRAVDHVSAGKAHHPMLANPFEAARCIVTATYRRILRDDYLPRIVMPQVWARYFRDGAVPLGRVTLESALAVLRFGHAQVQDDYDFSVTHSDAGAGGVARLGRLLDFFGLRPTGDVPVRDSWVIDWDLFFDPATPDPARPLNRARPLGPALVEPLRSHPATRVAPPATVPELAGFRLGLAWRTLAKGLMGRLPTGQAAARELVAQGLLDPAQVLGRDALVAALRAGRTAGCIGERCLRDQDIDFLADRTPLFFYILAEAQAHGPTDAHLGPLGSDFVAETFATALVDTGYAAERSLDAAATALHTELYPDHGLPVTMPALIARMRAHKAAPVP
ncbi:MAG: peroxidase family protein [Gemmobacter sp.]|nr:peroxidase family protein [Gemmobacter sp.]